MVATYNPLSEVPKPHHWKEMNTYDKKNLLLFFFISQEAQKPMKKKKQLDPPIYKIQTKKIATNGGPPPRQTQKKQFAPTSKRKKKIGPKKKKTNLPIIWNSDSQCSSIERPIEVPLCFHPTIFTFPLRTRLVTSDNGYRPSPRNRSVSNWTRYLNSPGCNRRISHRMV